MRRLLFVMVLILLPFTLFAFSFGYGAALSGQAGPGFESSSGEFSLLLDPSSLGYGVLDGAVRIGFDERGSFGFNGFTLNLYSNTFRLIKHPFSFMFSSATVWSPRLGFGVDFTRDFDLQYRISLSPLHFEEVKFTYDFLMPYLLFDNAFKYDGWGLYLMKISYFI